MSQFVVPYALRISNMESGFISPRDSGQWLESSLEVLHTNNTMDFWRCRFCGRANEYSDKSCPGCGAREIESRKSQ